MKLAELSSLAENKAAELETLQGELGNTLANDSGGEDDRRRAGDLLRRTMELWDEVDEMMAHVWSIKSKINIPQLGMSIADAELVHRSFGNREEYVLALIEALWDNQGAHSDDLRAPEEGEFEAEAVHCPHCGRTRGIPIDLADALRLLQAIRDRRTALDNAIRQATWQVETTWCDNEDDAKEITSKSVADDVVVPAIVEELGIREGEGEILRPAEPEEPQYIQPEDLTPPPPPVEYHRPAVQMGHEVIDPRCPFCMTPGRENLERYTMAQGIDMLSVMVYAQANGIVPADVNPSLARIHFDDHFKVTDYMTG